MAISDGFDGFGSRREQFPANTLLSAARLGRLDKQAEETLSQLLLVGHANAPGPAVVSGLSVETQAGLTIRVSSGIAVAGQSPKGGGSGAIPPTICRMENFQDITLSADASNDQYFLIYAIRTISDEYDTVRYRDPNTGVVTNTNAIVRQINALAIVAPGGITSHAGPFNSEADALNAITDDDIPLAVVKVAAGGTGPSDITITDYRIPFIAGTPWFLYRMQIDFGSSPPAFDIHPDYDLETNIPEEFLPVGHSNWIVSVTEQSTGQYKIELGGFWKLLPMLSATARYMQGGDSGASSNGILGLYNAEVLGSGSGSGFHVLIKRYNITVDSGGTLLDVSYDPGATGLGQIDYVEIDVRGRKSTLV